MLRRAIPVTALWPFVRELMGGRARRPALGVERSLPGVRVAVADVHLGDETDAERWTRERIELLRGQ